MITPSFGKHGVRLDVYVDGGAQIYNVEMQTTSQIALSKRALYYSSVINVDQLPRGGAYDQLRPSYVIFICKFDPFGKNQYLYSFRYACNEAPLDLEDGSHIFFLNTRGMEGNITDGMKEILRYMNDAEDFPVEKTNYELIRKIDRAVVEARADDDWRREYMTYLVHQRAAKLEGIAIGEQRGREEGKILGAIEVLRQTGMNDSAIKNMIAKSFNLSAADVDKYMTMSAQ